MTTLLMGAVFVIFPVSHVFGADTGVPAAGLLDQFTGVDRMTSTALLSVACVFLYKAMVKANSQKDELSKKMVKFLVDYNVKMGDCLERFSDAYEVNSKSTQALTEAVNKLNVILLTREGASVLSPKSTG